MLAGMVSMVGELSEVQLEVVTQTSDYVRDHLAAEPTGHDWWHAERVRRLAGVIAAAEHADFYVVQLASLLHDIADFKFTGSDEAGPREAEAFLQSLGVPEDIVTAVSEIIARVSFKGAGVPESPLTLEGQCVQDADRLDAIGAIGVARTFAYGGYVGRPIHDPGIAPVLHETADAYRSAIGTTVNHFHEKLLLLQDRLKTDTARQLAHRRHEFLQEFLARFELEWAGADASWLETQDGHPVDRGPTHG